MKSIGKTIKCIELSGIIKFLGTRIYQSAAKVFIGIQSSETITYVLGNKYFRSGADYFIEIVKI